MTVPVPCAVMPPCKGTVTGQRWSNRPHSASTKAETILNQVVPIIRRIAVAQPSVEDHVGVCPGAGFAEGCFVVHPGVDDRLGDRCHWVGASKVRRARPSTNGSGSARHEAASGRFLDTRLPGSGSFRLSSTPNGTCLTIPARSL